MHHPTDKIVHTTAFFYTSRGTLAELMIHEDKAISSYVYEHSPGYFNGHGT